MLFLPKYSFKKIHKNVFFMQYDTHILLSFSWLLFAFWKFKTGKYPPNLFIFLYNIFWLFSIIIFEDSILFWEKNMSHLILFGILLFSDQSCSITNIHATKQYYLRGILPVKCQKEVGFFFVTFFWNGNEDFRFFFLCYLLLFKEHLKKNNNKKFMVWLVLCALIHVMHFQSDDI